MHAGSNIEFRIGRAQADPFDLDNMLKLSSQIPEEGVLNHQIMQNYQTNQTAKHLYLPHIISHSQNQGRIQDFSKGMTFVKGWEGGGGGRSGGGR